MHPARWRQHPHQSPGQRRSGQPGVVHMSRDAPGQNVALICLSTLEVVRRPCSAPQAWASLTCRPLAAAPLPLNSLSESVSRQLHQPRGRCCLGSSGRGRPRRGGGRRHGFGQVDRAGGRGAGLAAAARGSSSLAAAAHPPLAEPVPGGLAAAGAAQPASACHTCTQICCLCPIPPWPRPARPAPTRLPPTARFACCCLCSSSAASRCVKRM